MNLRQTLHVLLLLSVIPLWMNCSNDSGGPGSNGDNQLIIAVEAVQARYGSLPLTERLSGIVKARNQVEILPRISAAIEEVLVDNGDTVERGQQLVRLRDREYVERLKQAKASYQIAVAQARQAEARLNEIQSELNRIQSLAEKNLTSPTELETIRTEAISAEADVSLAKAQIQLAEANVDEQEEALSQTIIRAPVTGTVGTRNAEVGMMVNSNTRLFTMGQLDSVRVEIVLTDQMLSYIETGQRAEIYAEKAPFGSITASLSRISPFLHPVTHSTDAQIEIPNPEGILKPGMFVPVDIYHGESEQATLVPLSALYENPGTGATGVYVCRDTLAREPVKEVLGNPSIELTEPLSFEFVPVNVIAQGRMTAGISGVGQGSWVVTIGQDLLNGKSKIARVRPVNWDRVERLQKLQSEDLLQDVLQRQQETRTDSTST